VLEAGSRRFDLYPFRISVPAGGSGQGHPSFSRLMLSISRRMRTRAPTCLSTRLASSSPHTTNSTILRLQRGVRMQARHFGGAACHEFGLATCWACHGLGSVERIRACRRSPKREGGSPLPALSRAIGRWRGSRLRRVLGRVVEVERRSRPAYHFRNLPETGISHRTSATVGSRQDEEPSKVPMALRIKPPNRRDRDRSGDAEN